MTTLVITVIGEERPGLVSALADVVADHGGSWARSQLAELAGMFAGIVTVEVPADRSAELTEAVKGLHGVLETTVREAGSAPGAVAPAERAGQTLHLDLVGNDRPGIVQEITGVLAAQQVSVESLQTRVVPAREYGGVIFEARAAFRAPDDIELDALQEALERLANELQVDIVFDADDTAAVWE